MDQSNCVAQGSNVFNLYTLLIPNYSYSVCFCLLHISIFCITVLGNLPNCWVLARNLNSPVLLVYMQQTPSSPELKLGTVNTEKRIHFYYIEFYLKKKKLYSHRIHFHIKDSYNGKITIYYLQFYFCRQIILGQVK